MWANHVTGSLVAMAVVGPGAILRTRVHGAHVNPVPVRRDAFGGPEAAAADAALFDDPLSEENMVRARAVAVVARQRR